MTNEDYSFAEEYQELKEFLRKMQEAALAQSDSILSNMKELEYKKRQKEYIRDDLEKRKIPNISMFSPLSPVETEENDFACKDELQEINASLEEIKTEWQKQQEICHSFDRLNNFFNTLEQKRNRYLNDTCTSINYSTKLLETQEMDRNRISRDLHDSTVQNLTILGHKLEYCSKLVDKDPISVKLELQTLIDFNKEIINDMREIIYDLRPMSLSNIGFVATVEAYCQHLRYNDDIGVAIKIEGNEQELSSIMSVTLYRIIQEACNNVIKHAKATQISIRIAFNENDLELDIEDNGVGFELTAVENQTRENSLQGFGLSTMKERARLLSGSLSINTQPGAGTGIHVIVPVNYTARKEESYE